MLDGVFNQQLDRTWKHKSCHHLFRNIGLDAESDRESLFQQVNIKVYEDKLIPERDDHLILALEHVPVYSRKLMRVRACTLRAFFAYEAVKYVEGVE